MTALENFSDSDLLQSLGEDQTGVAFEQLLQRYRMLVFGVAFGYTRELKTARAVTERVFLRLTREAAAIRGRVSLEDWLRRAAGEECEATPCR